MPDNHPHVMTRPALSFNNYDQFSDGDQACSIYDQKYQVNTYNHDRSVMWRERKELRKTDVTECYECPPLRIVSL